MFLPPFLKKYNYHFPQKWGSIKPPIKSFLYFKAFSILRKINYKYFKNKSEKIGLEGTIYGDIQREGVKKTKTLFDKKE